MITVDVHGEPKAQPRPRPFTINGRARVYDPGTAEAFKSEIAAAFRPHLPAEPMDGPISLRVVFRMPRPKGHYRTGRHAGELRGTAPAEHVKKPDLDNMVKAVKDCLTVLGVWRDDCQVVREVLDKRYVRPGERMGATIVVQRHVTEDVAEVEAEPETAEEEVLF